MSPRNLPAAATKGIAPALRRLWFGFGDAIRDARRARGWAVTDVARQAHVSVSLVYLAESGEPISLEAAVRLAMAFGLRLELELVDARKRTIVRQSLSADPVHSAMGEFEAGHLRDAWSGRKMGIGLDEPYQHFQFAGRADLV